MGSSWNVGQVTIGSTTAKSNWDNPCNGNRYDGRVDYLTGYADPRAARRAFEFHCQ